MSRFNQFSKMCRVCLQTDVVLINMFTSKIVNYKGPKNVKSESPPIWEMLNVCAPVEVSNHDGLPECICKDCLNKLNLAYNFRELCIKTDTSLKFRLLKIQAQLISSAGTEPVVIQLINPADLEVPIKRQKIEPSLNEDSVQKSLESLQAENCDDAELNYEHYLNMEEQTENDFSATAYIINKEEMFTNDLQEQNSNSVDSSEKTTSEECVQSNIANFSVLNAVQISQPLSQSNTIFSGAEQFIITSETTPVMKIEVPSLLPDKQQTSETSEPSSAVASSPQVINPNPQPPAPPPQKSTNGVYSVKRRQLLEPGEIDTENIFKCGFCNTTFAKVRDLCSHISQKHNFHS